MGRLKHLMRHGASLPQIFFFCVCTRLRPTQEMSMVGAAMGILTVVGNATDGLLNAVGLAVLLYARRKVTLCVN